MERIKSALRYISPGSLIVFFIWVVVLAYISAPLITHTRIGFNINLNAIFEPFITGKSTTAMRFYARCDIPIFTVLTEEHLTTSSTPNTTEQASQASCDQTSIFNQNGALTGTPTSEMKTLLGRITLSSYAAGDKIDSSKLGPKISISFSYQVRELIVTGSTSWIQAGDTMNFFLLEVPCSSFIQFESPATPASSTNEAIFGCATRPQVGTYRLIDTEILQTGTQESKGLIPYLVAIPTDKAENNQAALSLLDSNADKIIAYPEMNVIPGQSTATP